ncbi:hypothetical protein MTO96_032302, partial [Rhipicephalus appendiculatus]
LPLHPTLQLLRPRPGEPGSPENPGTIQPGTTQLWLASAFHHGFIPRERVKIYNRQCTHTLECKWGDCCVKKSGTTACRHKARYGRSCTNTSIHGIYKKHCDCLLMQGEREAEVFGESKDEGASGQTEEALVVEPAENESAADLLVVPTVECGLTLCDYEETHPPSSPSVAFVSGATPDCVGVKPSDQDDCNQDSAPRERKRL